MKKLLIVVAVMMTAVMTNAASFLWTATEIYGPTGSVLTSGTAYLYCDAVSSEALINSTISATGTIMAFNVSDTTNTYTDGASYDFYFKITVYDTALGFDRTYTSNTVTVNPFTAEFGSNAVGFGSQATASQNQSGWQPVPEPTSGLLLLLGMAGLALKRKRA